MIYLNDFGRGFELDLHRICSESPYGVKIEAYFSAYKGNKYDFLDLWICSENKNAVAVICRYYNTVTICGKCNNEISDFLSIISPQNVFCDKMQSPQLPNMMCRTGEMLKCVCPNPISDYLPNEYLFEKLSGEMDSLKNVYDLLINEYDAVNKRNIGEFNEFFVDISHRIRHRVSDVYVVYCQNKAIASATITISRTSAVISDVITHSNYRCRGIARHLIEKITNDMCKAGKIVFLYREKKINIYEKSGFVSAGHWCLLERLPDIE